MFELFNIIAVLVLLILALAVHGLFFLYFLYGLAVLLPGLAVTFRRLHDTGRSAWWILIGVIPIVGSIVLLVFTCLPGAAGPNQYGPDPKAITA
jgi:uncharacterized membrane protein YhaH (DUF805 family)